MLGRNHETARYTEEIPNARPKTEISLYSVKNIYKLFHNAYYVLKGSKSCFLGQKNKNNTNLKIMSTFVFLNSIYTLKSSLQWVLTNLLQYRDYQMARK